MIGIVIVAHGGLAKEYLAAVEHVVGNQPGITAVSVAAECDRPGKVTEIKQAIEMTDKGEGVVVVTDMFGEAQATSPAAPVIQMRTVFCLVPISQC